MIKLRKIDIEGFRGARLPVVLDFTATCKSVIVYGPNGSGKSTFSDAIEWFFTKRVNHLWREDCFEEALRNLNLTDTESAVVRLKFSDSKLDCEHLLDGKLNVKRSNNSADFKLYIDASAAERLILRYAELQEFITKTKGDKKKVIAEIIGFDDIVDFRNTLNTVLRKLQDDAEFSAARRTLDMNRGKMMERFKRFIESDAEAYSMANDVIAPFSLGVPVSDWASYGEAYKMLEGRVTAQERGAAQVSFSSAITKCVQAKEEVANALAQIEAFSKQYGKVLETKERIIQLNIEEFLKSGRKILDEGWAKPNTCPFCGNAVDLEHLREELNERIEQFKAVREEYDASKKSKEFALSSLEAAERSMRDILDQPSPYCPEEVVKTAISKFRDEAFRVRGKVQDAFQIYANIPDLTELEALSDSVSSILQTEKKRLEQKAKELEITADEKSALVALDILKELRSLFQESSQLSMTCRVFQAQIASFSKLRDTFIAVQNSVLQEALDTMSSDIGKYYKAMHPEEEVDNVKLTIVGEEGVEFRYSFHGNETGPPGKYLSESHLNSLGISLFLAAIRLFNKRNEFFVLDDVVTSFDSDHRMRLLRLLEDQFSHYQIILLTHEQFWFDGIREELSSLGWLVNEVEWDYDNGIRWEAGSSDLRKLIEEKKAKKLPIGNDIRRLLERRLKESCTSLRVRVAYLPNDQNEKRVIGELLSELRSTLNDKKCPVKDSPELARLSTTRFLTNVESHDSAEEPSAGDLEVALKDVDALDALFRCPACGGLMCVKYERPAERKVYCKCGKTSFEWR